MKNVILSLLTLSFAGIIYAGAACCPVAGEAKEAKKEGEAKASCCATAKAEGKDCGSCKSEKSEKSEEAKPAAEEKKAE